ncbi:MAG: hypothetical protein PHD66_02755 [Eubacteriales bacterium]|nr:hypothetical protein [Eubacteriales bacterium]
MTGTDIYNTAMDLCALRNKSGAIPSDCSDLTQRATALINILIAENAYLDSLIKKQALTINPITELSNTVELSELICAAVLPYGLACLLIQNEDTGEAMFFKSRYEFEKAKIQSEIKGVLTPIKEVY